MFCFDSCVKTNLFIFNMNVRERVRLILLHLHIANVIHRIYDLFQIHYLNLIINIDFILYVLYILLVRSHDIHLNPGPDQPRSSLLTNSTGNLSILQLNVRYLRNKLSLVESEFSDYDIICLTETHLNNSISDESLCLKSHPNYVSS